MKIKSISKILCVIALFTFFNNTIVNGLENKSKPRVESKELLDEFNKVITLNPIKGDKLSDEEAIKVIKNTLNTMRNLDSYETDVKNVDYQIPDKEESQYSTIELVQKGQSKVTILDGSEIYVRDGKSYFISNGKWKVSPLIKGYTFINQYIFDENQIGKLEVFKVEDGYVIQTKDEISQLEYYNLFIINDEQVFKPQEDDFKVKFQIKVDKDGRITEHLSTGRSEKDGNYLGYFNIIKLKNFNEGQEIVFPLVLDTVE